MSCVSPLTGSLRLDLLMGPVMNAKQKQSKPGCVCICNTFLGDVLCKSKIGVCVCVFCAVFLTYIPIWRWMLSEERADILKDMTPGDIKRRRY